MRPGPREPCQRYNIAVPDTPQDDHKHHRHAVYASETTGLLIIAFVLLILIVVRYWHHIHWSLR
jgi:hypothetical protein